jgi:hypothetical protein
VVSSVDVMIQSANWPIIISRMAPMSVVVHCVQWGVVVRVGVRGVIAWRYNLRTVHLHLAHVNAHAVQHVVVGFVVAGMSLRL